MLTLKRLLAVLPKDAIAAMLNDRNPGDPSTTPPTPPLKLSGKDILISNLQVVSGRRTSVTVTMRPPYAPTDFVPYTGTINFTYNRLAIADFAALAMVNYRTVLPTNTLAILAQLELIFGCPFDPDDFVVEQITNGNASNYLLKTKPTSLRWYGNCHVNVNST